MKKFKFCVCGLCIAIAAGLFAKANLVTPIQKEALLISNVEALSESFEWADTWWNDTDKHDWIPSWLHNNNWKPDKIECEMVVDSWINTDVRDYYTPIYTGVKGFRVQCINGDGNCFNGSSCATH